MIKDNHTIICPTCGRVQVLKNTHIQQHCTLCMRPIPNTLRDQLHSRISIMTT